MKLLNVTIATGVLAGPAAAADLTVSVEIPRLSVAEYHRPYVAFWLETPDSRRAADLAVWYHVDARNDEGETWLKDLRQWWRRSGRALDLPIDGLSRPTRAPGTHEMEFAGDAAPLAELPAGEYRLVVEAAREVGGREVVEIPFQWPPAEDQSLSASGESELGEVVLTLTPSGG